MIETQMAQIRELLGKKTELFQTILACAEQQAELSYLKLGVKYNNMLAKRAYCIERIKKTDAVLHNCLIKLGKPDEGFHDELVTYDSQIKDLIRRIMAVDEGNKKHLVQEQKTVQDKLRLLREGKKVRRGYQAIGKINVGGAFMDTHR
jgi:uncharacterized coiled-coil DUF342 family protein